jgi:hypothetical protein
MTLTRDQATAAVAAATAERDDIQANLLDLDASFGKRLLAGGDLTGVSRQRWDGATADLVMIWEIFHAYSTVIDHTSSIAAGLRRSAGPELAELTTLLTGPCVPVTRAPRPLGRRQLTETGRSELTLAAAVREMTSAFTPIAAVTAAAESVWDVVSDRLDQVTSVLAPARRQAAELADAGLAAELAAVDTELGRLRGLLNSDPLSLWRQDRVDRTALDRLLQQAQAAATQLAELARLRDDADRRIAAAGRAIAVARAREQDARAAFEEARRKIIATELPSLPPSMPDLAERLARLDAVKTAGRWLRLAADLDLIEQEAASAARGWQSAERAVQAILDRRSELRGLLDAYRAKAARLGGAERAELAADYARARDLLWTAPCDLAAAADAVRCYQNAVLALPGRTA